MELTPKTSNVREYHIINWDGALKTFLVAATDTTAFLVHNSQSGSKLYRIHYSKDGNEHMMIAKLLQHEGPENSTFTQIACGKAHILLLDSRGTAYSFGTGSRGELGHGCVASEPFPKLIEGLEGLRIIKVAAGGWHSAAISEFHDVYLWGWNESGQLGQPRAKVSCGMEPILLDLPYEVNVEHVACGSRHTVLKLENGKCFFMGCHEEKKVDSISNEDIEVASFEEIYPCERIEHFLVSDWTTVCYTTQ